MFTLDIILPHHLPDSRDVAALNRLMKRLSPDAESKHAAAWKLYAEMSTLIVARDEENRIIGTASLVEIYRPLGKKGLVEDVVVFKKWEGKGVGRELMESVIKAARIRNIVKLELTSRPERERANTLYPKLGFKKRETNVYQLDLRD